jgi:dTMP kinase
MRALLRYALAMESDFSALASLLRGRFIVFDGPDGSGKSTQFRRFVTRVEKAGVDVCEVREPGGTAIGEQIRTLLLNPENKDEINIRCEMLLFMASRAQLVSQRIAPARKAGQLILADRFISSTLAYQGAAGGVPIDDIMNVGRFALGNHWPDVVVIFDVDARTAASRLSPLLDRMEQKGESYHRTVREGYLQQAKDDPEHYIVLDARASADEVEAGLHAALLKRLAARGV